jgi:putative nucleotidyltransferase with HDIG domain
MPWLGRTSQPESRLSENHGPSFWADSRHRTRIRGLGGRLNACSNNQIRTKYPAALFSGTTHAAFSLRLTELKALLLIQRPDIRLSNVLAGLSYALDLTEGQREGHSVRSCLLGMRIAKELQLTADQRSALFYALLMKDLGCSSNAARFSVLFGADDQRVKADLKTTDWPRAIESFRFVARNVAPGQFWLKRTWQLLGVLTRGPEGARDVVLTRCERGADIARTLGFQDETVQAIRALDEHWDGAGQPHALKGEQIPLLARVLGLAQTVEVFFSSYGVQAAYDMALSRRGSWFDPDLVDALLAIRSDNEFWRALTEDDGPSQIAQVEPADKLLIADDDRLDRVAEAFALVIDAKSPWTFQHSRGVAATSVAIAEVMGYPGEQIREIRRAALLHDIGKLGVSSLILDKPGKLTDEEFQIMRRHPIATREILNRTGCFRHLANAAASHHERLDGTGYDLGLGRSELPMLARVLCTSDVCDALRGSRPYRAGMPTERVLDIMGREVGAGIDPTCFEALQIALGTHTLNPQATEVPVVRLVSALADDYRQAA